MPKKLEDPEQISIHEQDIDSYLTIFDDLNPLPPEFFAGPSFIKQPTSRIEERDSAKNLSNFSQDPTANTDVSEVRKS